MFLCFGVFFGGPTVLLWGPRCFGFGCGGFLLSHTLAGAVPSAFTGLASRFGMGLGVSPWLLPPQVLIVFHPFFVFGVGLVVSWIVGCEHCLFACVCVGLVVGN